MTTILAFVWRSGSSADPSSSQPPLTQTQILGPRIAITCIVFIGVVYLVLITRTLKSYGMDGGSSQNILTSPQTRLGVLGQVHTHAAAHVARLSTVPDELTMEVALERRGREMRRNESAPRGRRRDERPEIRKERRYNRGKLELNEENELGLFPVNSNSSTGRVVK